MDPNELLKLLDLKAKPPPIDIPAGPAGSTEAKFFAVAFVAPVDMGVDLQDGERRVSGKTRNERNWN